MDFWRLYYAHKKRERQRIRMLSMQMMASSHYENPDDAIRAELEGFQDLWYVLTETPRPAARTAPQLSDEEFEDVTKADLELIEQLQKEKKVNG